MSGISSAYSFPIFVSSAVYNLVDLRAELKSYLTELGYNPYVSDGEGFHSSTPELSPYESCLKVLSTSFIMILIIDYKYGKKFKWTYWNKIIGGREVSPTHGEYLFANKTKMRMLVFVRQEVLNYYQVYLNINKNEKDKDKAAEILTKSIPKYIDADTLEFIHEVKNTEPIPWLKGFNDVTDIKKELKSNMVNELAQLFLIKTQHLETVTLAFAKALENLSNEERTKVLTEIGVTKELIEQIESKGKKIDELTVSEAKLKAQVKAMEGEKLAAKHAKAIKPEKERIILQTELLDVEKLLSDYKASQENLLYGTVSAINRTDPSITSSLYSLPTETFYQPLTSSLWETRHSPLFYNTQKGVWEHTEKVIGGNRFTFSEFKARPVGTVAKDVNNLVPAVAAPEAANVVPPVAAVPVAADNVPLVAAAPEAVNDVPPVAAQLHAPVKKAGVNKGAKKKNNRNKR